MGLIDQFVSLLGGRVASAKIPPPNGIDGLPPLLPSEADAGDMVVSEIAEDDLDTIAGLALLIEYVDASGRRSRRRITCRSVQESEEGSLYLQAHCHERNALRHFRLDRIENVTDLRTGEIHDNATEFVRKIESFELFSDATLSNDNSELIERDRKRAYGRCRDGIRILVFLARCDGDYHQNERAIIADYIRSRCNGYGEMEALEYDVEELLRYADRQYPNTQLFGKAIRRIAEAGVTGRHIRLLLDHTAQLIDADGEISPEEFEFAVELKNLIGEYAKT
jgi:hypothetical protein